MEPNTSLEDEEWKDVGDKIATFIIQLVLSIFHLNMFGICYNVASSVLASFWTRFARWRPPSIFISLVVRFQEPTENQFRMAVQKYEDG